MLSGRLLEWSAVTAVFLTGARRFEKITVDKKPCNVCCCPREATRPLEIESSAAKNQEDPRFLAFDLCSMARNVESPKKVQLCAFLVE